MALDIIWSKKAAAGYSRILLHLDENWTAKEVSKFEKEISKFLNTLSKHPHLLEESKTTGIRKGPINKLTILTYRVALQENQIQLINISGARQKPLI